MQREKQESQTIVINTPSSSDNSSTFAQETLEIAAFHYKSKEKIGKMRIIQMFLNKISQRESFTAGTIYLHRRITGNDKNIANVSEEIDKTVTERN